MEGQEGERRGGKESELGRDEEEERGRRGLQPSMVITINLIFFLHIT